MLIQYWFTSLTFHILLLTYINGSYFLVKTLYILLFPRLKIKSMEIFCLLSLMQRFHKVVCCCCFFFYDKLFICLKHSTKWLIFSFFRNFPLLEKLLTLLLFFFFFILLRNQVWNYLGFRTYVSSKAYKREHL